jgi:hypothetical protein
MIQTTHVLPAPLPGPLFDLSNAMYVVAPITPMDP